MFFDHLTLAPQEGLFETYLRFLADNRDDKVNLSIGMYYDDHGQVPLFSSVQEAEKKLAEEGATKAYQPMAGHKGFQETLSQLVLGEEQYTKIKDNLSTFEMVGATGALRVFGDLLVNSLCDSIYLPDPTWSNHRSLFSAIGLKLQTYPYMDKETNTLCFDKMLEKLRCIPKGSAILFHTCCHNPTGIDPTVEQWKQILDVVVERNLFSLLDTAYQGLANSLDQDAFPVRYLAEKGAEFACTVSASKNFGLYGERVGLLIIHSSSKDTAQKVDSRLKVIIRAIYSNPPIHGAAVVNKILSDISLKQLWEKELDTVRSVLFSKRKLLCKAFHEVIHDRDFSFIESHHGMFSMLGLNPEKVRKIEEKGFYLAPSGRINVAGINETNVTLFANAMREVLHNRV